MIYNYLNIILGYLVPIGGLFLFDWTIVDFLFCLFLYHFIKVPTYIILYKKMSKGSEKSFAAFVIILVITFLIYAFFYGILMYAFQPKSMFSNVGIMDAYTDGFSQIFEYYSLPLLAMIVFEFLTFRLSFKKISVNLDLADTITSKVLLYYAVSTIVLILPTIAISKEFDNSVLQQALIVSGILLLSDLILLGKYDLLGLKLIVKASKEK